MTTIDTHFDGFAFTTVTPKRLNLLRMRTKMLMEGLVQKRLKKFSATRPFNKSQTEEAEKDAVSELADKIADWLTTTY